MSHRRFPHLPSVLLIVTPYTYNVQCVICGTGIEPLNKCKTTGSRQQGKIDLVFNYKRNKCHAAVEGWHLILVEKEVKRLPYAIAPAGLAKIGLIGPICLGAISTVCLLQ